MIAPARMSGGRRRLPSAGSTRTRLVGTLVLFLSCGLILSLTAPVARTADASFEVGAAVANISPPAHGQAPGGDPAECDPTGTYNGPRLFAFEEPYVDLEHRGHYELGDPYLDCNGNGRWDGNLLGGGNATPRFFDQIADPVTARAMVVSNGTRTIAVEVVDQEGVFNVYQERIRAKVQADGFHIDGIFISATGDMSAPGTVGPGGVNQTTSDVNDYYLNYFVAQSASAIERAYDAMQPATIRYADVLEPSNFRQCWSSYPFIDDRRMPVLQAVDANGGAIATLVSVSQHADSLAYNGGTPTLDAQHSWISADWPYFFRAALERRFGGVAIEMAGAIGSVETPEVYSRLTGKISSVPQRYIEAQHPGGDGICRTLFTVGGQEDLTGALHVPLGYNSETEKLGQQLAAPVIHAIASGSYSNSETATLWGARTSICVPNENLLFAAAAAFGVYAHRPGYNADCTVEFPVLPNGSSAGAASRSDVAAFRIGDGEFISLPGWVSPVTVLRGFVGPQDMPISAGSLPPWPMPYMHTPFRFIDGLGEDFIGEVFPSDDAVAIPTATNPQPNRTDRFGCLHPGDWESAFAGAGNRVAEALVRLLGEQEGAPERVVQGRYILRNGTRSRDPLGGPEIKCSTDTVFNASTAVAIQLADGTIVHPASWMSLDGRPQARPDRDTRGYFDAQGRRVWLDVFPEVASLR
jgi:hypothetical protein